MYVNNADIRKTSADTFYENFAHLLNNKFVLSFIISNVVLIKVHWFRAHSNPWWKWFW